MAKDVTVTATPLNEHDLRVSLALAEKGDIYEGKRVIYMLYFLLSPFSKPRNRKKSAPLPDYVNDYLMGIFKKVLNGVDANEALNLSRPGRPPRLGHIEKRLAASMVSSLINKNELSIKNACDTAENEIHEIRQKIILADKQLNALKISESVNNKKLLDIMHKHKLNDDDIWSKTTNISDNIKQLIDPIKNSLSDDNDATSEIYKNISDYSAWWWLKNKFVSAAELQQWYYKYKNELQEEPINIDL